MGSERTGLTLSLCKAFDILNCFTSETPALRVVDITRMVELTQSNVSRLVNTMVSCGYLERLGDSGYFQLGKRIITLSSVALNHSEIRRLALPELFRLEQRFACGANLAVPDQDQIYYLAHVDSRNSPRMYTMVGYTNRLHCTAIGKVLLAAMPDERIAAVLERAGMEMHTCHTITTLPAMMEQIARIRKCGYATEYSERILGNACIAAPIRDRGGSVVAGLSISGKFMGDSMELREEEAANAVMESAAQISNKLGFL